MLKSAPKTKIWKIRPGNEGLKDQIAQSANISPAVAQVLINRGVINPQEAKKFLSPSLKDLHDPFLMKDLEKAVDRIKKAIQQNELILIYGDYDVDGITGVSLFMRALSALKAKALYYIPHRVKEGYGLNKNAVMSAYQAGVKLLITCDCGIDAREEVDYANSLGIDIIITDHHEPKREMPKALAVLNPKGPDYLYPFKELAGVGVAFKLICGLMQRLNLSPELIYDNFLDLVSLGTIADLVPLLDENRIIAKLGLERLSKTKNVGLRALLKVAGLESQKVDAHQVSFILAPRLNAAGRLEEAAKATRLLLTEDESKAEELARELNETNLERQFQESRILEEALDILPRQVDLKHQKVIVLSASGWHTGVIGIVASRLVELYHRPAILIAVEEDKAKGSARSIPAFHIFQALAACGDLFTSFGGHQLAAGMTLRANQVEPFRERINQIAQERLSDEDIMPKLIMDAEIEPGEISYPLAREISQIAPFGSGNPIPIFACNNLRVVSKEQWGEENEHLRLRLRGNEGSPVDCVGFDMGNLFAEIEIGQKIDACFSVELQEYQGLYSVRLNLKDLRPSQT